MTPRRTAPWVQWLLLLAVAGGLLWTVVPHRPAGSGKQADGAAVYAALRCGACHGDDRGGKPLAPPLHGLAAHWTADKLVSDYFPDPQTYQRNDPRLAGMLAQYSVMKMPPVTGAETELQALAEWLLVDQ